MPDRLMCLALVLSLCGCDGTPPPASELDAGPLESDAGAPPPAPVEWSACDPDALPPGYSIPADLECTHLEVPLDHAAPDGERILLRVARHRATVEGAPPVFQLAGGPGGSAVAQAGIIERLMPRLRERFDLVYVDQRGTGDSGFLGCPGGYPGTGLEWQRCARALSELGVEHYLSADAADDLDFVRDRLGYDRVYLRGGSYGTRLGIEYARRHGDRIAAMVLDGADPPDADVLSQITRNFDRGMSLLYADCAADEACRATAPDLEASVDALIARADSDPRGFTVDGTRYVEDRELVLTALQYFVETAMWRFRIPRAVVDALEGRYTRLDNMLSELWGVTVRHDPDPPAPGTRAQDSYVAPGLYMVVGCAESLPNAPSVEALRALGDSQKYGNARMADFALACASLDVTPLAAELRTPVVSDVPALVLSGALDLNTIPEWGDEMVRGLSNGTHIVVEDATHSVMVTPCGADIIEQYFLAEGDLDRVDVGCAAANRIAFD